MDYPNFDGANCAGMDVNLFFMPDEDRKEFKRDDQMLAKVCSTCPVLNKCLQWALHHELHGYWGGTTEKQRVALRRTLKIEFKNVSGSFYVNSK